ncbi:flavodoxin family protein [Staphylothermus hellenicus]|uniref:NADPH-dependent FMN reductase n=1 Tax=Staphylothermus hellenicus (strain DSM 12710 / JCM 10830 / BK20S6-10-b1 / P8) TaxID=591019 RepID=D7DC46_STAHD|nr:flavodoxin family protein [Staphylothermus hellenicus]ADI31743.1 NADPH-dependent FMN reductase [Staphylothermus hellenicus DSM 12710]
MSKEEINILIINASPRKYGNSTKLSTIAEKGVLDAGGKPEKIFLYDYNIKECMGCVSDDPKICRFPCIIRDDDFNMLGEKILRSDGFIIVSPIYWYNVPGKLKNLIDRMTSMENMIIHTGRSLLEGKVAGFIAVGNDSGSILEIAYLMVVMNSMGIHIPPWALAYHHSPKEVLNDEQAVRDSYNVGFIVTIAAKMLKERKQWYKNDVDLEVLRKIASKSVEEYIEYKHLRQQYYRQALSKENNEG